jgi:hypothetical protein
MGPCRPPAVVLVSRPVCPPLAPAVIEPPRDWQPHRRFAGLGRGCGELLLAGAAPAGGAALVELLSNGASCVTC